MLKGRIDFYWPNTSAEQGIFKRPSTPFELSSIIVKGDPGRHLQGISFAFTNGVESPFFEHQSYGNDVAQEQDLEIDLEEPYNSIQVKVANAGDNAIVTGLRIGTMGTSALHHEWRAQGLWQDPIELRPNE